MPSKFALVIANTEYQDASFAKLTAPGKDAEEFAYVLREPELAAFDDVQVLLNEGESKIRRSIARFFVDRKRDDLLLLYFSGHGIRNDQGQLFLAANDTEIKILEASGIPAEFVTYAMNNSRSQRQLLILDCCNSGAFAHGSKSASAVGKSMGIATAFEGSGFGRVVLTATDSTQYAWEGDKVIGGTQKSVFTHFLIEGLKGEADRDSDGRIHVDELYDYVFEQVVRRTPRQTPGKWSYKQQGEMILRENLKIRDVKPVPLPSDLNDLLSHPNSGVRKVGMQDLIGLLDSKHLGLARSAEEKLHEIAENDDSFTLRKTANDTLISRGFKVEQPVLVEIPGEKLGDEKKIERPPAIPLHKFPDLKKVAQNLDLRIIGGIAGGLLIISLLIWGGLKLLRNLPAATSAPTRTFQTTATFVSAPSTTIASQSIKNNTPTPTFSLVPTSTGGIPTGVTTSPIGSPIGPCFGLAYVNDVTIPDNTPMTTGQTFTKAWRVKNTGSCAWDTGFKFVSTGGNSMQGATHILSSPVAAGEEYNISISMTAPNDTGTFRGNWRMHTTSGQFFGDEMYVQIVVGGNISAAQVTSTPGIGSKFASKKDGMTLLYVPYGEVTMGSNNGDLDEKPVHKVNLYGFWIDQTEITNAMYAKCVDSGRCNLPSSSKSFTRDSYYGNSEFADYPVIYVDWNRAKSYCEWADRRLPTEAEWEKAARSNDGRIYPWGDSAPNNNLLNFNDAVGDTTEVGEYSDGASPYGALDMAGNVWEWVADWYGANYYSTLGENVLNPKGPTSGQYRIFRGGSWFVNSIDNSVRSSNRFAHLATDFTGIDIGFRCAVSGTP